MSHCYIWISLSDSWGSGISITGNTFLKLIIRARQYKLIRTGINVALLPLLMGLLTNQFLWIHRELRMMGSDNPVIWKDAEENPTNGRSTEGMSESILFAGVFILSILGWYAGGFTAFPGNKFWLRGLENQRY